MISGFEFAGTGWIKRGRMVLHTSSHYDFNVISLQGAINLSVLPSLTPQLNLFLQENQDKNIVVDLSEVSSIDSNTLRLLLNIKKRFEGNNKKFYLLRPSQDIITLLETTNLSKIISIITKVSDIPPEPEDDLFEKYFPFTFSEGGLNKYRCSCAVCGSTHVVGYLFDRKKFVWQWQENDYFPFCEDEHQKYFDYFSMAPIVCTECYMASIDPAQFNLLDENGTQVRHSICDDKTKYLLSKSIKKRKKMMEIDISVGDNFFNFPRNRKASYFSFLLTENCARAASVNKNVFDPYTIGYLNFLTLQYADDNKTELFDNCRTWLTQALNNSDRYRTFELARIFYISMIVALSLKRAKEMMKLYETFSEMIKTLPPDDNAHDIDSPHFWYIHASTVWKNEIKEKSDIIAS